MNCTLIAKNFATESGRGISYFRQGYLKTDIDMSISLADNVTWFLQLTVRVNNDTISLQTIQQKLIAAEGRVKHVQYISLLLLILLPSTVFGPYRMMPSKS